MKQVWKKEVRYYLLVQAGGCVLICFWEEMDNIRETGTNGGQGGLCFLFVEMDIHHYCLNQDFVDQWRPYYLTVTFHSVMWSTCCVRQLDAYTRFRLDVDCTCWPYRRVDPQTINMKILLPNLSNYWDQWMYCFAFLAVCPVPNSRSLQWMVSHRKLAHHPHASASYSASVSPKGKICRVSTSFAQSLSRFLAPILSFYLPVHQSGRNKLDHAATRWFGPGTVTSRVIIWQQGALTRVEKCFLPSLLHVFWGQILLPRRQEGRKEAFLLLCCC